MPFKLALALAAALKLTAGILQYNTLNPDDFPDWSDLQG